MPRCFIEVPCSPSDGGSGLGCLILPAIIIAVIVAGVTHREDVHASTLPSVNTTATETPFTPPVVNTNITPKTPISQPPAKNSTVDTIPYGSDQSSESAASTPPEITDHIPYSTNQESQNTNPKDAPELASHAHHPHTQDAIPYSSDDAPTKTPPNDEASSDSANDSLRGGSRLGDSADSGH